jgi:CTP:phosphocholine cytidylyltransferase-like protein
MRSYFAYLKDKDKGKQIEYLVTIKKNRPVRSVSANSYMWIVLQAIANHTGDTADDLHEFFKKKYLSKEVQGEIIGQSTKNLDTNEFAIYLKKVKEFAKTILEVHYIPEPEDRAYNAWSQEVKEMYDKMFQSV